MEVFNRKKMSQQQAWQLSIYFGNLIIWIAYNTTNYTSYIAGALSFSFLFYVLGLVLYHYRKQQPSKKRKVHQ